MGTSLSKVRGRMETGSQHNLRIEIRFLPLTLFFFSLQAAPQHFWICQDWTSQQQALPTQPCPPSQVARRSLCLTRLALSHCWMMNSCL